MKKNSKNIYEEKCNCKTIKLNRENPEGQIIETIQKVKKAQQENRLVEFTFDYSNFNSEETEYLVNFMSLAYLFAMKTK